MFLFFGLQYLKPAASDTFETHSGPTSASSSVAVVIDSDGALLTLSAVDSSESAIEVARDGITLEADEAVVVDGEAPIVVDVVVVVVVVSVVVVRLSGVVAASAPDPFDVVVVLMLSEAAAAAAAAAAGVAMFSLDVDAVDKDADAVVVADDVVVVDAFIEPEICSVVSSIFTAFEFFFSSGFFFDGSDCLTFFVDDGSFSFIGFVDSVLLSMTEFALELSTAVVVVVVVDGGGDGDGDSVVGSFRSDFSMASSI